MNKNQMHISLSRKESEENLKIHEVKKPHGSDPATRKTDPSQKATRPRNCLGRTLRITSNATSATYVSTTNVDVKCI